MSATFTGEPAPESLPTNNQLVLYELPTAWTRQADAGGRDTSVGSFRDVIALLDAGVAGDPFTDSDVTRAGRAYLKELGINGLELLPPADSFYNRQWGYGTTNFLAPDFELGFPRSYSFPAPNRDLVDLVRTCHVQGVRFFVDTVMAFSKNSPYLAAAPDDFFIFKPEDTPQDPDAHNSRGLDKDNLRNGFGSTLFRYARPVDGYDPVTGARQSALSPARQLMLTALVRWIEDFHVDGFRLDSVENVQNWDFIRDFTNTARTLNRARFTGRRRRRALSRRRRRADRAPGPHRPGSQPPSTRRTLARAVQALHPRRADRPQPSGRGHLRGHGAQGAGLPRVRLSGPHRGRDLPHLARRGRLPERAPLQFPPDQRRDRR